MKYIQKVLIPLFFVEATQGLDSWDDYKKGKSRLRRFILEMEQSNLCCYCEKRITEHTAQSHLEHIKPKHIDPKNLTFDYYNIAVSCEGKHRTDDKYSDNCGHKKFNYFDELLFLNPILLTDISEYFEFDKTDCTITASIKDVDKAKYTIELLNLNGTNDKLAEARNIAKKK